LGRHFWQYRFTAFSEFLEKDVTLSKEISAEVIEASQ
jgi:hypothetical protein